MEVFMHKINKIGIYLRKSRDEENLGEDILEKHKNTLVTIAEKNNWQYKIYQEIGSADNISDRPIVQELLDDVSNELYDAVLVIHSDRLSRGDGADTALIVKVFKNSETLIMTPDKTFDLTNENDDFYYDFESFMARSEYRMIKRRFREGKKSSARSGRWANGTPPLPYIYSSEKKILIVDEGKRHIYEMIKDMFLNKNMGTTTIKQELNRLGIPSPRNKVWYEKTVYNLLIDETHLGNIIFGKTKGNYYKGEKVKLLPKDKWIIKENCHEAVKTEEEHKHIYQRLMNIKKTPHKSRNGQFALTSLVFCGICGRRMHFSKRKRKNDYSIHLRCPGYTPTGERCLNIGGKESDVLAQIKEIITNKQPDYEYQINNDTVNFNEQLLEQKQKILLQSESALNKIMNAYENGIYNDEEFIKRKSKKQSEINDLKLEIKELKSNQLLIVDVGEIIKAKEFIEKTWDDLQPKAMNTAFRELFKKIIYRRDSIEELPSVECIWWTD
jgi:DNA invertase Pin-like site-specific DNA recombinase